MNKDTQMGQSEKSAKWYISNEFVDQNIYQKAQAFYAKNLPKGTSARRFSARGYMTKGTQVGQSEKSAKNRPKITQTVHQQGVFPSDM